MNAERDPFERDRLESGAVDAVVRGHPFLLILGYDSVKEIARNWDDFTSDVPFRVPIPPEHNGRSVAQLPLESNPPATTEYRNVVAESFSRATVARIEPKVEMIAGRLIKSACDVGRIEVMEGYALPVFVHALALMLGRSEEDAEEWLTWGRYVFPHTPDGRDYEHNIAMDQYLDRVIDETIESPKDDFFGLLATAKFDGRALTRDEILGLANLTLAGGRDTTTGVVTNGLHYLATHPGERARLQQDPDLISHAAEELLRYFSPLPYMGRVTTNNTVVCGHALDADQQIALGFASANRDERIFEHADQVLLDRRPNRHVAFGHGPHTCLGAPLARMILQVTLRLFARQVASMEVEGEPIVETIDFGQGIVQHVGFDELWLKIGGIAS